MIDLLLLAALRAKLIRLHTFVTIDLDEGPSHLWDGVGNSPEFNGNTHVGLGTFGSVDFGEDALSKVARPFSLRLSGSYIDKAGVTQAVDGFADIVGRSLNDANMQNREITVSIVLTDTNATTILHTTIDRTIGRIDTASVAETEDGFKSVIINVEDNSLLFSRIAARKMSLATHQVLRPLSSFLAQAATLRTKQPKWGVAS